MNTQKTIQQILQRQVRIINQKIKRCQEFANQKDGHVPICYRQNSPKQQLVLEHVIQFKRQFQLHNDQNRQLFLYPKNQCGIYKFISTTVRPTKLGFLQLYDYETCAKYMANFIAYQELDPPDQFPKYIPSPSNVARWQKGDSFDISILLSSLLIGVGYDAFCVYGIAPKQITTKNQALMEYENLHEGQIDQNQQYLTEQVGPKQEYIKIQKKKKIYSEFDLYQKEKKEKQEEEIARKGLTIDDDQPDQLAPDLYLGRRVHCWVLLKAGKRGVQSDLFIQPSTGKIYNTKQSPYLVIDGVFNNKNCFIHMQPKHRIQDVRFEFFTTMSWQYVMLDEDFFKNSGEDLTQQIDQAPLHKIQNPYDPKLQDLAQTLDMPPPWAPKIYIDKDHFLQGTPLGQQTIFYIKVKVQKYANQSQSDCLVKKLTFYQDYKKLIVKQIRYIYANRSDKLIIRKRFPFEFKTVEQYAPGKEPHWRQVIEIDRRLKIIKYYPNRNNDGLIKRVEKIGQKITQYYINRDDKVIYRSVRFDRNKPIINNKDTFFEENYYGRVFICKITQKYQKSIIVPANQQFQRIVVNYIKQIITVKYHLDDKQISPIIKEFHRDNILGYGKQDAQKKVDDPLVQQQNQKILSLEKQCVQAIKSQQQMAKQQNQKMRFTKVYYQKTLHDKARQKFKQNLLKKPQEDNQDQSQIDYLKPYLEKRNLSLVAVLSQKDAIQIKNQFLNKYRERIIARAGIIQKRLDAMVQKQNDIEDQMQKKTEDKQYKQKQKQLSEIKFKCQILQARSSRFQTMALTKFKELQQKLNNDPRLIALKKQK